MSMMDILKQEIERKKRSLQDKNLIGPTKKYFKKEELTIKEDEEYWEKNNKKFGIKPSELGDGSSAGQSSVTLENKDGDKKERILPRKEVIKRLRDRNEPILLFGENENEAYLRLKQLELHEPELDRGFRNDFQEAMEQVDMDYLKEIIKTGGSKNDGETEKSKAYDVKIQEMGTDLEEIRRKAGNLGKKKDDSSQDCETIWTFLKYLLELWGKKLNDRPETEKMSTQGKVASATYTQTETYLKPLLKQLKNNKVSDDILRHLILIVRFMLGRDYVKASDAYLQMAIGNAPWPIGVTMVGIHARTGREKIFAQNIAHVLNDETQRKYIQALKRLMTQCQRLFPTDPSRCVEYNA